jgi:RNA polymerase sigma factor (sigma-70 family)
MTNGRSVLLGVYLERRADLVRFFTARLRSASAAEDLVQDIYVRIAGLSPDIEASNPAGYLYRLGSNLMLDRLRGDRRTALREFAWRENHRTLVGQEEVSEDADAVATVIARQRLAAVVEALQALPPQTQRVFRLHKFDGLSHAEVAKSLGISRSAVEKHVMAVLKHLARTLP